jgi:ferrous iron transport protein A
MINLSDLKKNDIAVINKIDGLLLSVTPNLGENTIEDDIEERLLEMGFIEGATIRVMHLGVFDGNPIAVRINNSNALISLRKTDAAAILVESLNVQSA